MKKLVTAFVVSILFMSILSAQESDDRGYIVKVGDPAPSFEFKLTDGAKVKSKRLNGYPRERANDRGFTPKYTLKRVQQ